MEDVITPYYLRKWVQSFSEIEKPASNLKGEDLVADHSRDPAREPLVAFDLCDRD